MKLVNMKIDKAEREKMAETMAMPSAPDGPVYPYGLEVSLDEEALDKLGIDLPDVGIKLMLMARVDVTRASRNKSTDGGKVRTNRSVSLQITDLALGPADGDKKPHADVLYPGKG